MKPVLVLFLSTVAAIRLQDALPKQKPQMGWNSWNCYHSGVTAANLRETGDFLISSGLHDAGYEYVCTDDGWMENQRDSATHRILPNSKFTEDGGITNLTAYLHAQGLKFGIYSSASSVVCSGRMGSLYHEALDAQTYADWGVDYVKYDNCGEYALGNARFINFADAVNATARPMWIATEPFVLVPNPSHALFAHSWRTGNDIAPNLATILDRADRNDKWADIAPFGVNDPDMLEVGNGGLTDSECRIHFGLWSAMKSPLLLGTNLTALSAAQLAIISNKDVIAINQDALGVQAKKLAVDGVATPRFVGLARCDAGEDLGWNGASADSIRWDVVPRNDDATAAGLALLSSKMQESGAMVVPNNYTGPLPGLAEPESSNRLCGTMDGGHDTSSPMCANATDDGRLYVSAAEVQARCDAAGASCAGFAQWAVPGDTTYFRPVRSIDTVRTSERQWVTFRKVAPPPPGRAVTVHHASTGRCLTMGEYGAHGLVPLLMPCNASDVAQAWVLPAATAGSIGGLLWMPTGTALTVGEGMLYAQIQGDKDTVALPDTNYGNTNLTLAPYAPEAPCHSRSCDDYDPAQMWYWSPRLRTLNLGAHSASDYHCYGNGCYMLTGHMQTAAQFCLSHVLSYDAHAGTDPSGSTKAGEDVWGGPLSGGDFVMALVNRDGGATRAITARWAWLEAEGVGDGTCFKAKELFSGVATGEHTGGITVSVPPNDIALLRLSTC